MQGNRVRRAVGSARQLGTQGSRVCKAVGYAGQVDTQGGRTYCLALWGLDLAVLAGRCTLGDEAHTPPAHSLLHLLLDHLCSATTIMKAIMMQMKPFPGRGKLSMC